MTEKRWKIIYDGGDNIRIHFDEYLDIYTVLGCVVEFISLTVVEMKDYYLYLMILSISFSFLIFGFVERNDLSARHHFKKHIGVQEKFSK